MGRYRGQGDGYVGLVGVAKDGDAVARMGPRRATQRGPSRERPPRTAAVDPKRSFRSMHNSNTGLKKSKMGGIIDPAPSDRDVLATAYVACQIVPRSTYGQDAQHPTPNLPTPALV
jgi:hypothetical protein